MTINKVYDINLNFIRLIMPARLAPLDIESQPERWLLMKMLERAFLDLLSSDLRRKREARLFIFDEQGGVEDPFSFRYVCLHLELSPAIVMREIDQHLQNLPELPELALKASA